MWNPKTPRNPNQKASLYMHLLTPIQLISLFIMAAVFTTRKKLVTAGWSDLPQELVISLANRPELSFEDFIAFRAVCKSWRSAVTTNFRTAGGLTHRVPFLMFPEEEEDEDVDRREFYSLTRSKIYQLELPEAKRKVCYSSLG